MRGERIPPLERLAGILVGLVVFLFPLTLAMAALAFAAARSLESGSGTLAEPPAQIATAIGFAVLLVASGWAGLRAARWRWSRNRRGPGP